MGDTRGFRFGVQATRARSGAEWRELAQRAEGAGYSTLFVADHYVGKGPASRAARLPPQHLAPIAAMATAAAVTTTLRVGCRVFCIDYHVPAALAKEAATIDLLSDGRLELGIGAGWSEPEYEAMGLRFGPARERVDKLEEVVALLKAQWSGEPIELAGTYVSVSGYAGLPVPVQPHPPIMIGGGRKRVLSLAAREADVVSINNVPFDAVNDDGLTPDGEARRRYGWVCAAAGDRLPAIEIESSPFFTEITDDVAAGEEKVAGIMGVSADGLADHPNVLIGSIDGIVETLLVRREVYGAGYITVQQTQLDDFAPIVERLNGR